MRAQGSKTISGLTIHFRFWLQVDAFKFWFMLKARGESYMEEMVDNTFHMADLLTRLVNTRPGFRLVPAYEGRQCTNVGFWSGGNILLIIRRIFEILKFCW